MIHRQTFSAVLFDLDGTLLDTLDDLADSMNAVLDRLGCPAHPVDAYRYFVGNGIVILARRALPEKRRDDATVERCVGMMKDEYERRWDRKTRPYEGVIEMVSELHDRGIALAILSNKEDDFTRKAVARFLPAEHFRIVRGKIDGRPLKPDPTTALQIAGELGVTPADILYLGDTATDMRTAVAAGMCPVGALWGFRTLEELAANGAKHIVEHPRQIPDMAGQE